MSRQHLRFPHEKRVHRHQLKVRISDLNYGQHLGHDALVSLLHQARVSWWAAHGLAEWDIGGVGTVIADLAVEYRAEAFWDDCLTIELAVGEVGRKGAEIWHRIVKSHPEGEQEIAIARIGMVFFDFQARQAVAVPDVFHQVIKAPLRLSTEGLSSSESVASAENRLSSQGDVDVT
ncbi:hypothetical protein BFW38_02035 [Terasakiispira papahanaumokuakeensis]|uniref:Thioesterase n=1 Tax=Terasakiispira papahanaumokuakeensis TaxID=197479 RepID=A0A1E2V697_9GAMM|nr:thioesterase family protein [Terasakiispira papahanaumokuakeensis]ODC02504.1 hypothetical protein BFW38_02035 [Terasakiispira papahanaumokuakeensis]